MYVCMYVHIRMHACINAVQTHECVHRRCIAQALPALPADAQQNQSVELSAALAEKHERLLVSTP
jgi:hypothetical protein